MRQETAYRRKETEPWDTGQRTGDKEQRRKTGTEDGRQGTDQVRKGIADGRQGTETSDRGQRTLDKDQRRETVWTKKKDV